VGRQQQKLTGRICSAVTGVFFYFSDDFVRLFAISREGQSEVNTNVDPEASVPLNQDRRPTICKVDLDVQTPKPELNSWGVASNTLFTDMLTVTPKNSPDMHRKVRMPQSSKKKPQYLKSMSQDSGCISDDDSSKANDSTNVSMSSLVSAFKRFGKSQDQSEVQKPEKGPRTVPLLNTQKSVPLSRVVLDPYLSRTNSGTNIADQDDASPRQYLRSISSDAALQNKYSNTASRIDEVKSKSPMNVPRAPFNSRLTVGSESTSSSASINSSTSSPTNHNQTLTDRNLNSSKTSLRAPGPSFLQQQTVKPTRSAPQIPQASLKPKVKPPAPPLTAKPSYSNSWKSNESPTGNNVQAAIQAMNNKAKLPDRTYKNEKSVSPHNRKPPELPPATNKPVSYMNQQAAKRSLLIPPPPPSTAKPNLK